MSWLRDHRRKKILQDPFPDGWRDIMFANLPQVARLEAAELTHLCELVQVFIGEKTWEGAGGLELDDEIRVTIAANACLLVLALPHDLYRKVDTIIVYPSTVVSPPRPLGMFEVAHAPMPSGVPILGQAHMHGPVILSWDAVRHGARHPERGHNVVFHELAHKLDMLDGSADGTPPLEHRAEYKRWSEVLGTAFSSLYERTRQGVATVLDAYGNTNEAELFAVATESFFTIPVALRRDEPELYDVLRSFYRQDPAARAESSPLAS